MVKQNLYRLNVASVIVNSKGQLLLGRDIKHHHWQFPQGGVDEKEHLEDALFRELFEEVGLTEKSVTILDECKEFISYDIPEQFRRTDGIKGQQQKWYLLQVNDHEPNINLNMTTYPEFDQVLWVSYWYPLSQVIYFKRQVYMDVLKYFIATHRRVEQSYYCRN